MKKENDFTCFLINLLKRGIQRKNFFFSLFIQYLPFSCSKEIKKHNINDDKKGITIDHCLFKE